MNVDFDGAPPPTGYQVYPDIVRIVDDPTDQMLNSVNDDGAHFPVSFPPSARPARHPAPACPAAQAAALAQQPWQPFGRRLLLRFGGLGGRTTVGGGQRGVEHLELAGLGCGDLQPALSAR